MDGSLRIKDVSLRDEDTYTCFATNFVGPIDSRKAKLVVVGMLEVQSCL